MRFEEFQKKYAPSLNQQQLEAVTSVEGPVLLLAVPGSGKTTVLITRLGYMILCCGIAPENILTVTYTKAATEEMSSRFNRLFGEELGRHLEFRTINGICAKIIVYYGKKIGKNAFQLVSDEKRILAMLSAIYYKIQGEYATESELKGIRTQITYIKNMLFTEKEIQKLEGESNYPLSVLYKEYCAEMRSKGFMDYDDQMLYAFNILRHSPEVLKTFQAKFSYLCVDESQDTSRIQHTIIALLAGKKDNLFLVGDEDQSIYGFRAAYPQALLSFEKQHPQASVLLMEENFRSTQNIVSAADRFIQNNQLRHPKHMKATRKEGTALRGIQLKSRKAQYNYLVKAAALCKTETAVLYRDNESVIPLVDLLERNHLPYRFRSREINFFTNRLVVDLKNIILFAINPYDTELFLQIYYKLSTFINKQNALNICRISQKRKLRVLDAAVSFGQLSPASERNCRMLRTNLQQLLNESAEQAIYRIMTHMGYGEYLERASIDDGKLFLLRVLAGREESPQKLVERLDTLQQIIQEKEMDTSCPFILSTIHASKGLEYDTVYLMDVADGLFPENIPKSRQDATEEEWAAYEEERRLFYVGVTRAKNHLNLFQFNSSSTFVKELLAGIPGGNSTEKEAPVKKTESKTENRKSLKKDSTVIPKTRNRKAVQKENIDEEAFHQFYTELGEGLLVRHKTFGEGVILSLSDEKITIQFGELKKSFLLRILYTSKALILE